MQRHKETVLSDGNVLYLDWERRSYINAYVKHKHICMLLHVWEQGVYGNSLYLPLNFVVNLKLL